MHYAIRQIKKLPNCQLFNRREMDAAQLIPMGRNHKQSCNSEIAKWRDIFTPEECAAIECKITLVLSDRVMDGFIMSAIIFMTTTSSQSLDV